MNTSRPTTETDGLSPRPDDLDSTAGPAISPRWRLSVLIMALPAVAVLIFGFFTGASVSDMKPHAMPLGIAGPPPTVGDVGRQPTVGDVGRQLATGQQGAFRIRPYTSVGAAEQAVRNREVVAALCGDSTALTAIIAGGEGFKVSQSITALAQQVATRAGLRLRVHDVAPLPDSDPQGVALPTLLGSLLIPGIVGILTVAVIAKALPLTARALLVPVAAIVAGLAAFTMLGPGLNILSGGSWQVAGLSMLYLVAIIGAGLGLVCALGPPGVAIVALTTMTLGNATSSANVPVWFLPDWMSATGPLLPPNAFMAAGRSLLYFDGAGLTQPVAVLLAWAAGGYLLIVFGRVRRGWR
ncbi:ABC transporter permease [Streptosporangium canum]|uniref:ABC transporter permease n=1 Tax=Streptosporangium canum TaxID=324952 RepID=UPI00343AA54B